MRQAKACQVASNHPPVNVPSKEHLMSHRLAYVFGAALVLPLTAATGSPAGACGHAAYFVSATYSTTEGSSVNVAIRRDANSCGGPSSVEYATVDGSAKAGSDYTAVSGTATFEMGPDPAAQRTFAVPVMKDSEAEGAETFTVVLRMNAAKGVISSLGPPATVTIAASTQSAPASAPTAPGAPAAPAIGPASARTATTNSPVFVNHGGQEHEHVLIHHEHLHHLPRRRRDRRRTDLQQGSWAAGRSVDRPAGSGSGCQCRSRELDTHCRSREPDTTMGQAALVPAVDGLAGRLSGSAGAERLRPVSGWERRTPGPTAPAEEQQDQAGQRQPTGRCDRVRDRG